MVVSISFSATAAEKTPEEMIQLYFDAFKKNDLKQVADNMHEGELAKFKDVMMPVIEKGVESAAGGYTDDHVALRLFVQSENIEAIRADSPKEFFLRFLNWVMQLNPMMKTSLDGATIQVLGSVPESDMAHVVYRMSLDLFGARMSQLAVMSVKKQDGEWKLMMTGEIEGMGKLLQMNMNKMWK